MLELGPTCEHCNKALPADSLEARICTYECTFCVTCVDSVLGNVCPNCGGGFVPRPIRPSKNWKGDNFLGKDPPRKLSPFQFFDGLIGLGTNPPPQLGQTLPRTLSTHVTQNVHS